MTDLEVPTPSPVPSPPNGPFSLSERININTRSIHSLLNRSIIARLPLALPPNTENPSLYISGILHIAPIYLTFESLWQTILDTPRLPTCSSDDHPVETCKPRREFSVSSPSSPLLARGSDTGTDACDPEFPMLDTRNLSLLSNASSSTMVYSPIVCSRTHSILSHLRLPGLLRGGRLLSDIRKLTGTPEHKIDKQIAAVSDNGRLAAFLAHTKQSVETNPHVLLAYAWVLYMAMFSGGRYIRASLQAAGGSESFWNRDPSPVRPYTITSRSERRISKSESPTASELRPSIGSRHRSENHYRTESNNSSRSYLQFFNFMGDEDGEDIKREFKKRMTEAEVLLTEREREEIVAEAQDIFKFMVEMVAELDSVCGTKNGTIPVAPQYGHRGHRGLETSRDSVHIAQVRLSKRKVGETQDSFQVTQDRLVRKKESPEETEDEDQDILSTLEELLSNSPSPKGEGVVRFEEPAQATRRSSRAFLVQIFSLITKPLGRTFSQCGFEGSFVRRKSKAISASMADLHWSTIFVTGVTTSILMVVFLSWYFDYGLGLHSCLPHDKGHLLRAL